MELEEAVRTRRTHKAYAPDERVPRDVLVELFELARWAPNHHLTNPWRFTVLGPEALGRLKAVDRPEAAAKLDRAPTLVAVTSRRHEDPVQDAEDLMSSACAAYVVLLAAHARGYATYWRTPGVLRSVEGKRALGLPEDDHAVGLLHLGVCRQDQRVPERAPVDDIATFLG